MLQILHLLDVAFLPPQPNIWASLEINGISKEPTKHDQVFTLTYKNIKVVETSSMISSCHI